MPEQFLHGVEVVEIDSGPRPIRTVKSSIIGIVGTAPIGPVNTPVLIAGSPRVAGATFGDIGPGAGFTLPPAFDGIFDQAGAMVVAINVLDPAEHKTMVAAAPFVLDGSGKAMLPHRYAFDVAVGDAVSAPATFGGAAPGVIVLPAGAATITVRSPDGATLYDLGDDYTVAGTTITRVANGAIAAGAAVKVGYVLDLAADADYVHDPATGAVTRVASGGILPGATLQIGYARPDPTKVTMADIVGSAAAFTGVHALRAAQGAVKVTPRILCAPGFTHQRDGGFANPVAAELVGIAERLRAVIIVDGPNTTDQDAITAREDWGSRRVIVADPWPMVLDTDTGMIVAAPPSARIAGLIARTDNERGFWWSPSNQPVNGILGTARPVDFTLGDPNCVANYLNENEVATVIHEDGYRLWGNRTCASDPKWAFLSVVRTSDMINDSLLRAHLWAVDRNITRTYMQDVVAGVTEYLASLEAQGAILGGRCWADPDLNTPANITQGKVFFDFDFTPPYPAEHVTFRSHLVNDYIETILDPAA